MKHLLFILSLMLLAGTAYSQENRIKPEKNIEQAPGANYIMLSDVERNFQIVPSSSLPGGGGGDIIQNFTYDGDLVTITTDQNVFSINVNANTVETTAPISINGNVYPSGTDIQTILGGIGVAINNISLVDNGDGTYTFTDTDGTTIAINTVRRAAFYHYPGNNNSYSLPLDTLAKYDLLTITMRHSTGTSPTLTLPEFPADSIFNGKTIVIHFEGSEDPDSIFVEAAGLSQLVQIDCSAKGKTIQSDTIISNQDNDPGPNMIVYRTSYQDDYIRQCEGLIQLGDGNLVLPGDALLTEYETVPYMLARQELQRPDTFPVTDFQASLTNALDAKIVEVGNEWRMYFLGYKSYEPGIDSASYYYQTSTDEGRTWTLNDTVPFFTPEKNPDSLDLQLWEYFILKEDMSNWKMYYQGAKPDLGFGNTEIYRTFLATSSDGGDTWIRQGLVLDAGSDRTNDWDGTYAGVRSVVKFRGQYILCYEGRNSTNEMAMGIAISDDGINFTKVNSTGLAFAFDPANYPWETNAMLPYVQVVDSVLVAMYGNNIAASPSTDGGNRKVGLAYSTDGIKWTRYNKNPVIDLEGYPNYHNDRDNAFVSFYEYKPGSWALITREKGFAAENYWDNGLYYLGNNLNFDTAYVPEIYANTWFVNSLSGNDASVVKGRRDRPFKNLSTALGSVAASDKVFLEPGHYNHASTYSTPADFSLKADIGSTLNFSGGSPIFQVDNGASFVMDKVKTTSSVFWSQVFDSTIVFRANELDFTNASADGNSAFSITSNAFVEIGLLREFKTHGFLAISGPSNSGNSDTPNQYINIGSWVLTENSQSRPGNVIWYYGDLTGSSSDALKLNSNFKIGSFIENTQTMSSNYSFIAFGSNTARRLAESNINIDVSSYYSIRDAWNQSTFPYTGTTAIETHEISAFGGTYNSVVNIDIHSANTKRLSFGFPTGESRLNSTQFNVNYGNIMTDTRLVDMTGSNVKIEDSTTVKINCIDCHVYKDVAIKTINFGTFDPDCKVEITGNYRVHNSLPVIYTNEDLYLHNVVLENDGTVPVVEAPSAVTVYVSGAFNLSGSPLDPDVTFVRLPELGDPSFEISITGAATNGSGDITVPHSLGTANINVNITAGGTALRHFTVHSKTAADFTVRFYDSSGTPLGAGTNMDFDVQAKKQ